MSEHLRLEEYKVNIDLWKHEDTLRQQRNSTFLTVSGALLVAISILAGAHAALALRAGAAIAASVVGMSLCVLWTVVQARHDAYIRFRRLQLRDLESDLGFSTFTRAWARSRFSPHL
jgi:hypothetical protein